MHEGVGRLEGGDEELFEAGLDVFGEEGGQHVVQVLGSFTQAPGIGLKYPLMHLAVFTTQTWI